MFTVEDEAGDRRLIGLDADTGEQVWNEPLADGVRPVGIYDERLFVHDNLDTRISVLAV